MNDKVLSIIIKAQDEASKVLSGVGNKMEELGATALRYGKIAAVALGAAGVAAAGFAVTSAASFEQTRIGLQNMLGSADAARSVLAQVSKFAADTPFEFPELANSVKQLVAFGFSGTDAVKTMKQLGDVSAAVGAPIGDLSYLMGTLRTQGRAFTIDIRQFAQRGIPIYEYLAKVLHTNEKALTGMIEAGKVGFPEVQKAFELMTAEGGKFHGAMAAQSKSLSGLFSTLKDNIGLAAREMIGIDQGGDVKAGSVFDKLRIATAGLLDQLGKISWSDVSAKAMDMASKVVKALKSLAKSVQDTAALVGDYLGGKFEALWNTLNQRVIPALIHLWTGVLKPFIPVIGAALVGALGLAIDGFNALLTVLTPITDFLSQNRNVVIALTVALGLLYGVMKAQEAFVALETALSTLRMSFIVTTIETAGLRAGMTALMMTMGPIAAFMTGPLGLALGATALLIGVLTAGWMNGRNQADTLKDAQDRLTIATRGLKAAQDELAQSHLNEEGAALRVEQAQRTYNDTVNRFGPKSLEARQALHDLKQAQLDLRDAQDQTNTSLDKLARKQAEVSKDKQLVRDAQEKSNAIDGITRAADGAVISISKLATKISNTNTAGQKIDLSPILKAGHNAQGTSNWGGGLSWVGERGPELVNLPRGSQVFTNQQSQQMASGSTFNMYGNIQLGDQSAVDRFFERLDQQKEMAALGVGV